MNKGIRKLLESFAKENNIFGKGALAIVLTVTDQAKEKKFPLKPEDFLTKGRGQVAGASKARVQKILKKHGIERILAQEGGRTSRGSIGIMQAYVEFLNKIYNESEINLDYIEDFWIERVREFFARQPFRLKLDPSSSISSIIKDLLKQAQKRQQEGGGMQYAGAMLQHLVGAKLLCLFPENEIVFHSSSTADAPTGRSGDFHVGNYAIHVTMTPTPETLEKCRKNLSEGLKPLLVTFGNASNYATELATQINISNRIDIFDITQFIALNLHEWGYFKEVKEKEEIVKLIEKYNEIVKKVETDPSLRIQIG